MTTTQCPSENTTLYSEADMDVQLSYYNALVDKLNDSAGFGSAVDRACLKELATEIASNLTTNIANMPTPTSRANINLNTVTLQTEFDKLLDTQDLEDSTILRDMYKTSAFIFMVIFLILLIIYNLI